MPNVKQILTTAAIALAAVAAARQIEPLRKFVFGA